jgi:hypothetical protein
VIGDKPKRGRAPASTAADALRVADERTADLKRRQREASAEEHAAAQRVRDANTARDELIGRRAVTGDSVDLAGAEAEITAARSSLHAAKVSTVALADTVTAAQADATRLLAERQAEFERDLSAAADGLAERRAAIDQLEQELETDRLGLVQRYERVLRASDDLASYQRDPKGSILIAAPTYRPRGF